MIVVKIKKYLVESVKVSTYSIVRNKSKKLGGTSIPDFRVRIQMQLSENFSLIVF